MLLMIWQVLHGVDKLDRDAAEIRAILMIARNDRFGIIVLKIKSLQF